MTANNDSDELEALFDSIASGTQPAAPASAPAAPAAKAADKAGDDDELQALFDSVSAEYTTVEGGAGSEAPAAETPGEDAGVAWPGQESVFKRIGHMTRELHDTLRELGYGKLIEETVTAIPDAKDRLAYIANLTEQAACRVLNATDIANPLVDELQNGAEVLGNRWDRAFANELNVDEFKQLASETRDFLKGKLQENARAVHGQLTEIMMAQDFQDLTGQVIKKVVTLAHNLETGLMSVLIEVVPETKRTEEVNSLMNGPVVSAEGRSDVVVNQQQVDDLLESLGF